LAICDKIGGEYSFLHSPKIQMKSRRDVENRKKYCIQEEVFVDVDLKKEIKP